MEGTPYFITDAPRVVVGKVEKANVIGFLGDTIIVPPSRVNVKETMEIAVL